MVWSHEHNGHFRAKVKHILERMVRRFGFEIVDKHCPGEDRKLMTNIRKTKKRIKKRKDAAKEADSDDDHESEVGAGHRKGLFESEYDRALYSSGESEELDDDQNLKVLRKTKKEVQKGGDAYIVEVEDEPLDLLDRKALSSISFVKPVKKSLPPKSTAKVDITGKLILGQNSDEEGTMDIDAPKDANESGVGAYLAAFRDGDVPRRGLRGKLKWTNKRRKGGGGGDGDDDGNVSHDSVEAKLSQPGQVSRLSRGTARQHGGRSGKGGITSRRRALGEGKRPRPFPRGNMGKVQKGRKH
jgi:ribosomal RNA-processing protein 12